MKFLILAFLALVLGVMFPVVTTASKATPAGGTVAAPLRSEPSGVTSMTRPFRVEPLLALLGGMVLTSFLAGRSARRDDARETEVDRKIIPFPAPVSLEAKARLASES